MSGTGYDPAGGFSKDGKDIEPREDPDIRALIETGLICNHAHIAHADDSWTVIGSPTEAAFLVAAEKAAVRRADFGSLAGEFSFNSIRKRMSVVEARADGMVVHTKGAPEMVLSRSSKVLVDGVERALTEESRRSIEDAYRGFAGAG